MMDVVVERESTNVELIFSRSNTRHPLCIIPAIRQGNSMAKFCIFFFHFRYPRNQNCTWNITAEEGNFIIVDFDEFELEDPQPGGFCAFDYVTFSGGMLNALLSAIVRRFIFSGNGWCYRLFTKPRDFLLPVGMAFGIFPFHRKFTRINPETALPLGSWIALASSSELIRVLWNYL